MIALPPLSLYIHIPWCVKKCPYCDFNSHGAKGEIPEQEYIEHLLQDLQQDLSQNPHQGRQLSSIFIGGGTPSLLSESVLMQLLLGIRKQIEFKDNIEITLEANPGTLEYNKFEGFAKAGVTRLSIGVQSFQAQKLLDLGRIHNPEQAISAAKYATSAVDTFNIDLMHGLPNQSVEDALSDLSQAIALAPTHLSWYQLTIEPNTQFSSKPPILPNEDVLWEIQQQGHKLLTESGYHQYEISAYAKASHQCQHNLNYWKFGDYLGIGCGAHSKITLIKDQKHSIHRQEKLKHPKGYMNSETEYLYRSWQVANSDLPFEYFMNRLRLKQGFNLAEYEQTTGLSSYDIMPAINKACDKGLLQSLPKQGQYKISELGSQFYNNLVDLFL